MTGGQTFVLLLAMLTCVVGCESRKERKAREERERSELQLARLLKTRSCTNCYIVDAKVPGRDLRGIKLVDSYLHGELRGADLRGAQLIESGLGGDLTGVDLRGAVTSKLELNVEDGQLAGARLDALDLQTLRFPEGVDWSRASLRGANLQGLQFIGQGGSHGRIAPRHALDAPVGGAPMRGTDLREANLSDAWLIMSDLRDADLRGANLRGARMPRKAEELAGAQLEGAVAPDGSTCLAGSVGRCVTQHGAQPPWRDAPRLR